jgi:hypothetical protein
MATLLQVTQYWSALATAPAETSAQAKEASIINKIFIIFIILD